MANGNVEKELEDATNAILTSAAPRKLVVAGPGTGKTWLFRKLLEGTPGDAESRLVLTFIRNLKRDLEKSLEGLASAYTLHGYCQRLLHRYDQLRAGLSRDFRCVPGLASLIADDWEYLNQGHSPKFVQRMRDLADPGDVAFYFERANYYDAVDFDDSVYRTYVELGKADGPIESYDLVLIDEFQDFNALEAALIDLLAKHSPIVIAGDDDQALYGRLRGASWDHIRVRYHGHEYEKFTLPFCMRCPEVIVGAVNDIVETARRLKNLEGRIDKPYKHYEPVKGEDSRQYPNISVVKTSVQSNASNYFGRFIEQAIREIPEQEVQAAQEAGDPAALIIGSRHYLRQVEAHLVDAGFVVDGATPTSRLDIEEGYRILSEDQAASIGWRIILEYQPEDVRSALIRKTADGATSLSQVVPSELRARTLESVAEWVSRLEAEREEEGNAGQEGGEPRAPSIKLTSFEGAKGLSAQHVFIVGMHNGDLPKDAGSVQDIEICRFLVGLTRTRKKCTLLHTGRWSGKVKEASELLGWITSERCVDSYIDAKYWKNRG